MPTVGDNKDTLFITFYSTFRLGQAFIEKGFSAFILLMPNIKMVLVSAEQNGVHQQYEGNTALNGGHQQYEGNGALNGGHQKYEGSGVLNGGHKQYEGSGALNGGHQQYECSGAFKGKKHFPMIKTFD